MEYMNDSERITLLLSELGITQKEFANRLCLRPNTISMIKQGRKRLTERNMRAIAAEFNINFDWLKNGVGEMRATGNSDINIMKCVLDILENNDIIRKDIILKIYNMNNKDIEMCSKVVDSLYGNRTKK